MKASKKYFFIIFILLIKFHSSKWVIKAKQDSQTIINSFELTKGKFSKAAIYYEFDSSNLQILLPETKEYLSNINDESEYPSSALLIFKDAINNAEKILLKESINQKELDEALSYLNLSFENIKKYKGYNNYDTNRGFIHPGGLYTNDDINRIKIQLQDGNEKVKAAYEILKKAEWSQLKAKTSPAEVIIRGISGQENYINAARGATIAFQSALRWKIEEDESFAKHAVEVLMAWANTTKKVDGNSDVALALGLYGYEFAQAGEIMRDYEGWSKEDFEKYKKWMLEVWYPFCVRFLRKRNGTWKNEGKWWNAPGHYWSNWGLCNTLAVISIGILCDDVYIYNQGISFFKYDQVGTFVDPRTDNPIKNDGLNEFLGNLVVTTSLSDLEKNAYGKLGQMNESGRDMGHATMALGLTLDIALQAWKQGDDLFSYMDYRLAAGIEFTAAQILNITNLPWTEYHSANNGFYYTDNRIAKHTGPAYEYPSPIRPYWGIVIGIYEEIKGVTLPLSHTTYEQMGIDEGPKGSTSGGYDHIGYSVLLNTRDGLNPANKVPTELKGKIKYEDNDFNLEYLIPSLNVEKTLGNINLEEKIISHSELGGLINNYTTLNDVGIPKGSKLTLIPVLPEGEEDTGNWLWNTGETTKYITITLNKSFAYRVRYTNQNGIESYQLFTLAVQGDCLPSKGTQYIYNNSTNENYEGKNIVEVNKGDSITLELKVDDEFGTIEWSEGESNSYTLYIENVNENKNIEAIFKSLCGRENIFIFQIKIKQEENDENQEIKTYYKIQKKTENNEWEDTSDYLININELLINPKIENEKNIYFGVKCEYNITETNEYIRLYPTDLYNFEICEITVAFNNEKNIFKLDLSTNHLIASSYATFTLSHTVFNTDLFEIKFELYDKNGNRLNNDNNYLEIEQFLVDKFNSEEDFRPIHKKIIPKIDNNINLLIKILTDNICFISEMEQYEIEIIKPDKKCSDFKTNLECNDYLIVDLIQCLWIENICKEIIVDENCQILNGLCSFKVTPINGKLCSLNKEKTECLLSNIQNNDKSDEKENNEDKENENNNKDDKNDLSDKNINLNESYVNDERDKTDNNKKNNCNKIFLNYQLFILFFLFLV